MTVVPLSGRSDATDDLEADVAQARQLLDEAANSDLMQRDPYRFALLGMSQSLGVMLKANRRSEAVTGRVIAVVEGARHPLSADERAELMREIVAANLAGAEAGMRKEARRAMRVLDRMQMMQVAFAIGAAFVLGCATAAACMAYYSVGPFNPTGRAGEAWRTLAANNPDPTPALAAAEMRVDKVTGRRFYAGLSLWSDPTGSAPAFHIKP